MLAVLCGMKGRKCTRYGCGRCNLLENEIRGRPYKWMCSACLAGWHRDAVRGGLRKEGRGEVLYFAFATFNGRKSVFYADSEINGVFCAECGGSFMLLQLMEVLDVRSMGGV